MLLRGKPRSYRPLEPDLDNPSVGKLINKTTNPGQQVSSFFILWIKTVIL